jgi:hypothetical protein
MAGRRRHSAEGIVRKLRRADELTTAGMTGERIAAELGDPSVIDRLIRIFLHRMIVVRMR